jgi:GT2 family glycosyltransferase
LLEDKVVDYVPEGVSISHKESTVMDDLVLSIIIVSYNTRDLVKGCIESIFDCATRELGKEVIVVDNGSIDGTTDMLRAYFPQATVIENGKNAGLSAAWNVGVQNSQGKYLLFLNSDIVIQDRGALRQMIEYLESNPHVGLVAPKLFFDKKKEKMQWSCNECLTPSTMIFGHTVLKYLFPNSRIFRNYIMADWDRNSVRSVKVVAGAAFMIKREIFDEIGQFDERYFLYFEEYDLSKRMSGKWELHYLPYVHMIHLHAQTTRRSNRWKVTKEATRSCFLYFKKYYGLPVAAIMTAVAVLNIPLKFLLLRFSKTINRPPKRGVALRG